MAMLVRPDILVYAPEGHLAAAFDASGQRGHDAAWATEYRHNLLEYGGYPKVEFYLFVCPDRIWLWKDVPPWSP